MTKKTSKDTNKARKGQPRAILGFLGGIYDKMIRSNQVKTKKHAIHNVK